MPPYHVGEFIRFIGKEKALVTINTDGKYVVKINEKIDKSLLKSNVRIALRKDNYELTKILK